MQVWCLLILMTLSAFLVSQNKESADSSYSASQLDVIASNMLIYSSALSTYAKANPGLSTAVSDLSLTLPAWFVRIVGVGNYISAGKAYVYYSGKPELLTILADKTESVTVGKNQSGVLVSPRWGTTSIAIPAAIPNGAVVYVL